MGLLSRMALRLHALLLPREALGHLESEAEHLRVIAPEVPRVGLRRGQQARPRGGAPTPGRRDGACALEGGVSRWVTFASDSGIAQAHKSRGHEQPSLPGRCWRRRGRGDTLPAPDLERVGRPRPAFCRREVEELADATELELPSVSKFECSMVMRIASSSSRASLLDPTSSSLTRPSQSMGSSSLPES